MIDLLGPTKIRGREYLRRTGRYAAPEWAAFGRRDEDTLLRSGFGRPKRLPAVTSTPNLRRGLKATDNDLGS